MNIQVMDGGYFARVYGPKKPAGEEIISSTPIVLTPEMMAYQGWWTHQTFEFHNGGNGTSLPFLVIYKEASDGHPPMYRVMWRDSEQGKKKPLIDKLNPMLDLHQRLTQQGYDLGESNLVLPAARNQGSNNDRYNKIPLDQTYTPENQQLIAGSGQVAIASSWLELWVTMDLTDRVAIAAGKYFGAGDIVKTFAASNFEPSLFTPEDLQQVERHLDDLIKGFPEAPRR